MRFAWVAVGTVSWVNGCTVAAIVSTSNAQAKGAPQLRLFCFWMLCVTDSAEPYVTAICFNVTDKPTNRQMDVHIIHVDR